MTPHNAMTWQVFINGTPYEVDEATLRQWIAEGRVLPDDKVLVPGANWTDAGRIPNLRPAFAEFDRLRAAGPAAPQPPPYAMPPQAASAPSNHGGGQAATSYPAMPGQSPYSGTGPSAAQPLAEYTDQLRGEQNLTFAILAGAGAAIFGAVAWLVLTAMTGRQFGVVAIGIGLLVGFAVQKAGKGVDTIFGVVGAVCAFLSCFVGNLVIYAIVERAGGTGELFGFFDVLFYGLATYEGYKLSFRSGYE